MIWGTGNIGAGIGSGASLYGMTLVNYPESSELTISGGRALKRDITSTQRLYYVKEPATYSITSTDGVNSRTKDVTINTFGQSETITIVYALHLYKPGDTSGWTSMGWGYSTGATGAQPSAPTLTYETNDMKIYQAGWHSGIVYHSKVHVDEFSSLICTCRFDGWNSGTNGLYLLYNVSGNGSYVSNTVKYSDNTNASAGVTSSSGNMRLVVDVSPFNGEYYPAIAAARDNPTSTFWITGIWLE